MTIRRFLLLLLLSTSMSSYLVSQETHPFSVHDMWAMERVGSPSVAPDGQTLVFSLRHYDVEENNGNSDLWLMDQDGQNLRQLTANQASDHTPLWHPAGAEIWFLSSRSGSSQVWKISVHGGEATQVTEEPVGIDFFSLSPTGESLLFAARTFPECETLKCSADKLKTREETKQTGRVYNELFIRHWDVWEDGRRSHLFVQELVSGQTRDLMEGMHMDSPSRPFGGSEEFTFTPDGKGVVFTAKTAPGSSEAWSTNWDLYYVPLDGSVEPRNLTDENDAWDTHPVFSPDGTQLAYLAMSRAGYESDQRQIVVRAWPGGNSKVIAQNWDRSPHTILWTPDGEMIMAVADNLGQTSLFSVDLGSGQVDTVVRDGSVSSPKIGGTRIFYGLDNLKSPGELYSANLDGSRQRKLTSFNTDRLEQTQRGDYEQFTFEGWNGETVYAYLVKPANFDPNVRYPIAFLIHGGPQGSFGNHFHYRWNPQAYAGAGYAAIMVDFHGSTGYGQAFTDSIRGDWGGKPLVDLQKGLEAALEKYSWLDGDRVGALGASYGGYMINWIAGNWPDRFRALVNHDGLFDMESMYYATEELWFPEWEHGGPYWRNREGHERHNPANHVDKWKTPMLVVHGALDFRVPLEQGIATFTALQRKGVPSRFLYYPDENHWVLSPKNGIQWHETVLDWLDQWVK